MGPFLCNLESFSISFDYDSILALQGNIFIIVIKFLRFRHLTRPWVWNSSGDIRPELYLSSKCRCAAVPRPIQAPLFLILLMLYKMCPDTDYSWRGPLWRVGWQGPAPLSRLWMQSNYISGRKKGYCVHLGGSQKSNVSRKDVIIFRSADWLNSLSCNSRA